MSIDTARMLIIAGVVSALAGAVLLVASTKTATRSPVRPGRPDRIRPASRRQGMHRGLVGRLSVTSVMTGVITGAQWVVLRPTEPEPTTTGMLVLGVPAFLAAATITRLLAVASRVLSDRRRSRAARRQAGARR
jgi:hypothetical protein